MGFLYGPLIGAIWIAWYVYWEIAVRNVKSARRRESYWLSVAHVAPLVAAIALVAFPEHPGSWLFSAFLPRGAIWTAIGAAP